MNNVIKYISIGLIVLFASLLLAENFGYYKTREQKAKVLTEEQIKIFEEDIRNGKEIDIKEYVSYEKEDYSNNLSNNIYKVSLKLETVVDKAIKIAFNSIGKMVND